MAPERFTIAGQIFEIESGRLYQIHPAQRSKRGKAEFYEQRRLMLDANGRIRPADELCREYAAQITRTKEPPCKS